MQAATIVQATQRVMVERRHRPAPVPAPYRGKVECGCDEGWTVRHAVGGSFYDDGPLEPVRCESCDGSGSHEVCAIANTAEWASDYEKYRGLGGYLVVRVHGDKVDVGHCTTWEQAQRGDFETSDPADPVADRALLAVVGVRL